MTGNEPRHLDEFPNSIKRSRTLVARMAEILDDEDVGAVVAALALLNTGIVLKYAEDAEDAHEIICILRQIEDRLLANALKHVSSEIH